VTVDISQMLVGKSDQLDNVDLISGPRDFTITGISGGTAEQPLNITVAEFPRPWRPGLTMRRLLAALWGVDATVYVGRRVRLYRDAEVRFGNDKPGGTRISHASHIDKRVTVTLPTSKGKVGMFSVEPLPEVKGAAKPAQNSQPTPDDIAASTSIDDLRAMWQTASPERQALIAARVDELKAGA
jgi:hypothetical protein